MNKNAQEEIVGFVMIVVLSAIVLLIFLAILVRRDSGENYKDSIEVRDFVESIMEFTSNCAINYEPNYLKVGELIKECRSGRLCLSGKRACDELNYSLIGLIEAGWEIGENRPIKGYRLNSTYFATNQSGQEGILFISKGNCSNIVRGAEDISPDYPGNIITKIELCY